MEDTCSVCKKNKRVHRNRKTGKLVCSNCYQRDPSTHEKCYKCRKVKHVYGRTDFGKPTCSNCYKRDPSTHERCSKCGEVKYVKTRTDSGKPICTNCYHRSRVGKCVECKKKKIIQAFGRCYGCYQRQHRASIAARPA